jgi:hypothetical protein
VALTTQRLLFLAEDLPDVLALDIPLGDLTASHWVGKLTVGSLAVAAGEREAEFTSMNKQDGRQVADAVAALLMPARTPSLRAIAQAPDIYESLRKLGELRDSGVLSPEEFESKKRELLSRI